SARTTSATTPAAATAFVEPHPEAIARLLAMTRQTRRGLEALGGMVATSNASTWLLDVEDLLALCLRVAVRAGNDMAPDHDDAAALADVPVRLGALEARLEAGHAADRPLVIDVH